MIKRLLLAGIKAADFQRPGVIILILVNLIPILGVLLLNWKVFPIVFLYWAENVIIGFFNVLKMVKVTPEKGNYTAEKLSTIPFFCLHYGIFTLVHGIFVFVLFGGLTFGDGGESAAEDTFESSDLVWLALSIVAVFISHGVSYFTNYIGKGEYKEASLKTLMFQPYARVVILHVTILFGGFVVMLLGSPVGGLVLLVVIKIVVDVLAHLRQHANPLPF